MYLEISAICTSVYTGRGGDSDERKGEQTVPLEEVGSVLLPAVGVLKKGWSVSTEGCVS